MALTDVERYSSPVANMRSGPCRSVAVTWVLSVLTLGLFAYYANFRMYRDTKSAMAPIPTVQKPPGGLFEFTLMTLLFNGLVATALIKNVEDLTGLKPKTSWLMTFLSAYVFGMSAYQQARLNAIWRSLEEYRQSEARPVRHAVAA